MQFLGFQGVALPKVSLHRRYPFFGVAAPLNVRQTECAPNKGLLHTKVIAAEAHKGGEQFFFFSFGEIDNSRTRKLNKGATIDVRTSTYTAIYAFNPLSSVIPTTFIGVRIY